MLKPSGLTDKIKNNAADNEISDLSVLKLATNLATRLEHVTEQDHGDAKVPP